MEDYCVSSLISDMYKLSIAISGLWSLFLKGLLIFSYSLKICIDSVSEVTEKNKHYKSLSESWIWFLSKGIVL